jgi:ArsR family transcriptional regulator
VSQHLKQLCDAGLVKRYRDGQFVFYRVTGRDEAGPAGRQLLALAPDDEPQFERDVERLRALRGNASLTTTDDADSRSLHRALVELTVAAPLGDLLDIGSGQGRLLKLLASRTQHAIGIDIDSNARQSARAELLLAGVENVSLRKGDMYQLPFDDSRFDTIILDDVLADADEPLLAMCEASRLLKTNGRLLLLSAVDGRDPERLGAEFANWCRAAGLRLAAPRQIPRKQPRWLLAVATRAGAESAAA